MKMLIYFWIIGSGLYVMKSDLTIRNLNIFDELKRHLLSKETAFYTVL